MALRCRVLPNNRNNGFRPGWRSLGVPTPDGAERCAAMRALLYAVALMAAAAGSAAADPWKNFIESDKELLAWIEKEGGKIEFRVGKMCPSCMRGAFASRDFKGGLNKQTTSGLREPAFGSVSR